MSEYIKIIDEINNLVMKKLISILLNNSKENIPMSSYIKAHSLTLKILQITTCEPVKYLYNFLVMEIKTYLKGIYFNLNPLRNNKLIESFSEEINKIKLMSAWLSKLFIALEKHRNVTLDDTTLIKAVLINVIEIIINPLKILIFQGINNMITQERISQTIDSNSLINVIKFLDQVNLEDPIIQDYEIHPRPIVSKLERANKKYTLSSKIIVSEWYNSQYESLREYIFDKSNKEISICSAPEYIKSSTKFINDEENRMKIYFPAEIHSELRKIINDIVIKQKLEILSKMETGLSYMFNNNKQEELKLVYFLYSKLGDIAIKMINTDMSIFIKDKGNEIYNNKEIAKDPTKFIPELLKLKLFMDGLVENCFENNIKIIDSKVKAFTNLMNKEHYSKQLAIYCDFLMKVGLKGKNENQIEEELKNVLNLFKCLSNKLVFQLEYSKKLSERLISGKTVSQIAEKNLISKIKADQGVSYTSRLTNMFEDLDKSVTNVDNFRKLLHKGKIEEIMLSCQILQRSTWEIEESKFLKLNLTPKLKGCIKEWENFYSKNFSSHKLIWVYGVVSIYLIYL